MNGAEWKKTAAQTAIGTGTALAFSLVAVLLFAFIVKVASLPSSCISPVCRVIKTLAVLVGCMAGVRPLGGWYKGGLIGLFTAFLSFLLFSLLAGSVQWSWLLLLEGLFGVLTGILSGIIAGIIRK